VRKQRLSRLKLGMDVSGATAVGGGGGRRGNGGTNGCGWRVSGVSCASIGVYVHVTRWGFGGLWLMDEEITRVDESARRCNVIFGGWGEAARTT
jgi:hypothetical protein